MIIRMNNSIIINNLNNYKMNYNLQLIRLYEEKKRVKESDKLYFALETTSGTISIPKKAVINAYNSSIEHFKGKIRNQESLKK